jgi:tetratricopeptide (TPR) repeat protein
LESAAPAATRLIGGPKLWYLWVFQFPHTIPPIRIQTLYRLPLIPPQLTLFQTASPNVASPLSGAVAASVRHLPNRIPAWKEIPMSLRRTLLLVLSLTVLAGFCHAQSALLDLPRKSQNAEVTQTIGITNVIVKYSRPLVNDRKVWGGLVPYGEVWRAGANENTTITFTDPVSVEGKPLDKGTYGLFMIPKEDEWTVIFSKTTTAWGAFTYKPEEDVLRVNVKPAASDFHNALLYDFDQLSPDTAVVTLRWDKLAVPFKVSVNVPQTVEASLQKQFRGIQQYTWVSYDDAANYFLDAKADLPQGLKYVDTSIQIEERYDNLMTKSRILAAMGKSDEAQKYTTMALQKADAAQSYQYARQLQRDHKQDQAFAIYKEMEKKYPNNFYTLAGQARLAVGAGNYDEAVKQMKLCQAAAPDAAKSQIQTLINRLEKKENINQ